MKSRLLPLLALAPLLQAAEPESTPPPVEAPPAEVTAPAEATPPAEVNPPAEAPPSPDPAEAPAPLVDPATGEPTLDDPQAPDPTAGELLPAPEESSDEMTLDFGDSDELVIEFELPDGTTADAPATETDAEPTTESTDGWEFSLGGKASAELQWFPESARDPRQDDANASIALEPELRWRNKSKGLSFAFTPFGRLDAADSERTHADLREFSLRKEFDNSDLLAGVSKVFWGAMEAVHWVDVINQSDLIENIDGEAKLGQPMVNYNLFSDYGRFSFFVLPGFRERTFPGPDGRLRIHPWIDADRPAYESSSGKSHVDFAIRWSKSFGDVDLGVSYFHGTSREPTYFPALANNGSEVILRPYYEIIDQLGIDATWNMDDWLFKSEFMARGGQGDGAFFRAAAGFEYTFHGVYGSGVDVGVIAEYLYDSQGNNVINPFENDLAYGARITFNDIRDTTLLITAVTDTRDASTFFNLEATMRFGENWVVAAQARAFLGIPADDFPLNGYRRDHYVQLGIEYHF